MKETKKGHKYCSEKIEKNQATEYHAEHSLSKCDVAPKRHSQVHLTKEDSMLLPAKKRLCTRLNKVTGSTKSVSFYLPPNVAKHRTQRFLNTEKALFNSCTKLGIDYNPPAPGENRSATYQTRAKLKKKFGHDKHYLRPKRIL